MTYLPGQPQGQNAGGVPRQNEPPRNDPRAYQYRPIMPNLRIDPPITNAPTIGQYVRSDTRGIPGGRRVRWPGTVSFWLGLLSVPLLWVLSGIFLITALAPVAAAFSVVAIFFGVVAWVTGAGRGMAFWGILLALAGNIFVIQFLAKLFAS
ncbi:MAG: hypothetical protein ABI632_10450 [Pseudolysinimonas sp.]